MLRRVKCTFWTCVRFFDRIKCHFTFVVEITNVIENIRMSGGYFESFCAGTIETLANDHLEDNLTDVTAASISFFLHVASEVHKPINWVIWAL